MSDYTPFKRYKLSMEQRGELLEDLSKRLSRKDLSYEELMSMKEELEKINQNLDQDEQELNDANKTFIGVFVLTMLSVMSVFTYGVYWILTRTGIS